MSFDRGYAAAMLPLLSLASAGCSLLGVFDGYAGGDRGAAAASFDDRCSAAEVLRCYGFDAASDLATRYQAPASGSRAAIDEALKLSGAGALRFDVPADPSDGDLVGRFHIGTSDDFSLRIGAGETLHVQWRQRFAAAFLEGDFSGGVGWRQAVVGLADRLTHTALELEPPGVIVANSYHRGMPQMSTVGGAPFQPDAGEGAVFLQNVSGCNSHQIEEPLCVFYEPDQWMTFQVAVTLAPPGEGTSRVEAWVGREGEAQRKVIDIQDADLQSTIEEEKLGKVWFSLHDGLLEAGPSTAASVWIDELVMSRAFVADP